MKELEGLPRPQLGETLPSIPLVLHELYMALPPQGRDTLLLAMVESLGMLPSRIDYELEAIDPDTTIQNRIRNSTRRE